MDILIGTGQHLYTFKFNDAAEYMATSLHRRSRSHAAPPQASAGDEGLPVVRDIELVPTTHLSSDGQRAVFSFPIFNAVQSRCFNTAYRTDDNLVVSAPTGSGKTVVMELAICRLAEQLKNGRAKVVYQAPTKSLCTERATDWRQKFTALGLSCAELTGDTDAANLKNVGKAAIVVTTPEKWDSITRRWKDNARLVAMIKLFLIDEVHILKDARGATLEAIVSRMKNVGKDVRFVALSATIPNSDDIATWLGRNHSSSSVPAVREVFDDSFRPVKLTKHIVGYSGHNPWALESALTTEIPKIIVKYSKCKPTLVFCPTKESTLRTADAVGQWYIKTSPNRRPWPVSRTSGAVQVESDHLHNLVTETGVAFHNSSLSANDRHAVEKGFLQGHITVICSTSTLAVGVNLPCYLVILKGTMCYTDNGLQEYSCMEVMQMLGRAGRPQFESEAAAVILCHDNVKTRYERMITGEETVESSLHQTLIEHLNAEVSIGSIIHMESAKQWLTGTFLHVRLRRNPEYYNIQQMHHGRGLVAEALTSLSEANLSILQSSRMIEERNNQVQCTEYGHAMARYCVNFETMKGFVDIPEHASLKDILIVLAHAQEFKDHRLRINEKNFYREVSKAYEIRYPVQGDIQHTWQKIYLLLQAKFGCFTLASDKAGSGSVRQMQMDTSAVITNSQRFVRCIVDILVYKGDSKAVKAALELTRCLSAGVWDDSTFQLKQISGIGDVLTRKLAAADIKGIEQLVSASASRIEVVLSKGPPFGMNLLKKAAEFPRLYITVKEVQRTRRVDVVEVRFRCQAGFLNEKVPMKFNNRRYNIIFLCESGAKLIDFRRLSPQWLRDHQEGFCLTAKFDQPKIIACHIMCDELAGTHTYAELNPSVPTSWFSQPSKRPRSPTSPILSTNILQPASKRSRSGKNPAMDEFGSSDLDDADFLAAEANCTTQPEIAKDIDGLIARIEKPEPARTAKPNRITENVSSPGPMHTTQHQQRNTRQPRAETRDATVDEDEAERIYKADQKRKWATIESDWFTYDQYGHLVDILDDQE